MWSQLLQDRAVPGTCMRKKVVCSPLLAVGVLCVVVASALPALGSAVASPSSCQLSQINDEEVVDGMGSVGQKLNVLGTALQKCSRPGGPTTGFYRDGCCTTGDSDYGRHVVCSRMTQVSGPTQPRRGVGIVYGRSGRRRLVAGFRFRGLHETCLQFPD